MAIDPHCGLARLPFVLLQAPNSYGLGLPCLFLGPKDDTVRHRFSPLPNLENRYARPHNDIDLPRSITL